MRKENLDDKSKWVNQGYAHETDKIRKNIPEKIDIIMDFQVW